MKTILIVLVMKLLVFIGETTDKQRLAIARVMGRKGVAEDLMPLISGRIPNDWFQLQKVFLLTDRTRPIFDFTELHGKNPPRSTFKEMSGDQCAVRVDVDEVGRIVSIKVSGMTDDDIVDLTKLPSKLKSLTLKEGELSTLDIDGIPDSIEVIKLTGNHLFAVTWTKLPTSLEQMDLMGNQLIEIDLRALPPKLRDVQLINNSRVVVTLDARMSPTYLSDRQTIYLKMNDAGTGCGFGFNHKVRVMVDKGGVARTIEK